MWPTFYIPSGIGYPRATGELDHLCGVNECPYSIPAPASIEDGDIQVIIVSANDEPAAWPDYATDGWRELFYSDRMALTQISFGLGNQHVFWRFWTTGAADFVAPSGASEVCWVSVSLKNQNTDDPFFSGWCFMRNSTPYGGSPIYPANYIQPSAEGDVILQWTSNTRENVDATEAASGDIEFSCKNMGINILNDSEGHVVTGLYANHNVNNLLLYSNDPTQSAWSKVGATASVDVTYGSKTLLPAVMYPTTANSQHYIEQSVALEAGKFYLLAGRIGRAIGQGTTVWLGYEKPDTSIHGLGYVSAGTRYDLPGSTEVTWANALASIQNATNDDIPSIAWDTFTVPFYCDTTGTYKIRLWSSDSGADPTVAAVGSTNRWIAWSELLLCESSEIAQHPAFYPTGGSAVLPGSVPYTRLVPPKLVANVSDSSRGFGGVIVRRGGAAVSRPECELFNPATRNTHVYFDALATGDTRFLDDSSQVAAETAGTSSLVYEYLSHKKYYFEATVTSFGTGGTSDYYGVGFAPFESQLQSPRGTNTGFGSQQAFGAYNNQYAYQSSGKVYADGALDGTYTAWSVNDIIGCAIDFTNWQISFYRNGTLVRTVSIANDRAREGLWSGVAAWISPATVALQARFTFNFKGPFGGRKPSGFVAYDFDNEVT